MFTGFELSKTSEGSYEFSKFKEILCQSNIDTHTTCMKYSKERLIEKPFYNEAVLVFSWRIRRWEMGVFYNQRYRKYKGRNFHIYFFSLFFRLT